MKREIGTARDRHATVDEIERQIFQADDRTEFALEHRDFVTAVHAMDFENDAVRMVREGLGNGRRFTRAASAIVGSRGIF